MRTCTQILKAILCILLGIIIGAFSIFVIGTLVQQSILDQAVQSGGIEERPWETPDNYEHSFFLLTALVVYGGLGAALGGEAALMVYLLRKKMLMPSPLKTRLRWLLGLGLGIPAVFLIVGIIAGRVLTYWAYGDFLGG